MGVSKVNFGNQTLIDLTSDTVTAESLLEGYTAHGADGEPIVGRGTGGGNSANYYSIEDEASNAIANNDYIPFYDSTGAVKTKILFSTLKAAIDTDTKDWASITGKPSTFAPSAHTHAWDDITGKPSTFTPASHTHAWSEITGKPSVVDNLTSDSSTDILSAKQGKALKALIDGKTSNTGTVTSVATGTGLTGGTITGSGTLKANLKTFDPWTGEAKYNTDGNASKLYAVGVDKNGNLAVAVPWTDNNTTYPIRFKYLDANYKTQIRTQTTGSSANSSFITAVRTTASGIDGAPQWGTGITAGIDDTQIYLFASHAQANGVFVGGGNADKLNYVDRIYTTGYKPSKSDVGLGNVANIDQSKAIKGISRSGTTFTYTCLDGTTGTFTQQDNNTTYSITQYTASPTSLANFVQSTDTGSLIATLRFKDTGNYLGFGTNQWIRGYIQYQNPYGSGGVCGNGIVYLQDSNFYRLFINNQSGSTTAFTVTRTLFRSPTGNATAAQVLSGYTFSNASSDGLTGSISSKAAATYYTSTSDQTITSGQYLSGTQTIKAVTTSNISAGNIKSGVVVKVGDAGNAGRIANVTGTYKGSIHYDATLWTNPSPTSSFSEQDVSLNASMLNYSLICVRCRYSTSNSATRDVYFSSDALYNSRRSNGYFIMPVIMIRESGTERVRRIWYKTDNSVRFSHSSNIGSEGTASSYGIPIAIYGCNVY